MIKCPNCTGEMKFDPKLQKVKCEYCGNEYLVDELMKNNNSEMCIGEKQLLNYDSNEENSYIGKAYKCVQCGATLMTFDETAITFCSYCGSQAMLEDKMMKHNNPDLIIPFKKTKEECIKAYKEIFGS